MLQHRAFRLQLSVLSVLAAPVSASVAEQFPECLARLEAAALASGVTEPLLRRVMPELEPQARVLELDRQQPEFVQTFGAYLDRRVSDARVQQGRRLLAQYAGFLAELEDRYGVPPRYLIAFWGLETNYGSYLGRMPTLDSLATLACDPRRSSFFSGEFVSALKLLERESLSPDAMQGSWAGAVGHTQFMPSSYLRYAVDGDGDSRADLWRSERDALASAANFLHRLGWEPGLRWGRVVRLPPAFPLELAGSGERLPLGEWSRLGVVRADGSVLPAAEVDAQLLLPAGHRGPAFLVYDNFSVILGWNRSDYYALSVGLLADRLVGAPALPLDGLERDPLARDRIADAQRALNDRGFEAGNPDGILGGRTRAALRDYQRAEGLPPDGYPGRETLRRLLEPRDG